MCGTIGLAPAEAGHHSIVPPRRVGGNMDIRNLAAGTELYLPVEVAGGLFASAMPMPRRATVKCAARRLKPRVR